MLAFGLMLGLVSLNARDRALAHVQLVQGTKPSPVPPAPDPDLNPFLVPPTDKLFGEPKSKDDFFATHCFPSRSGKRTLSRPQSIAIRLASPVVAG